MYNIEVSVITTDHNQLSTGTMWDTTVEQWLDHNHLSVDDIVDVTDTGFVVYAEWGNGEGGDTYEIEITA